MHLSPFPLLLLCLLLLLLVQLPLLFLQLLLLLALQHFLLRALQLQQQFLRPRARLSGGALAQPLMLPWCTCCPQGCGLVDLPWRDGGQGQGPGEGASALDVPPVSLALALLRGSVQFSQWPTCATSL